MQKVAHPSSRTNKTTISTTNLTSQRFNYEQQHNESPFEHAVLESSFSDGDPNFASDSEDVSQPEITTYTMVEECAIRAKLKLFNNSGLAHALYRVLHCSKTWRCAVRNSKTKCLAMVRQKGLKFVPNLKKLIPPSMELRKLLGLRKEQS